ncbi:MAG: transposase [Myxococcales bacterium]|nr:transposase [Myxococcales bacterium]
MADRDHVLFSYVERHTQDAVASLFKGFRGYLQSDASSVYDILDRGHGGADPPVLLVGCWAHTRRYFFENQEQELRRVFLDGRLPLDNTRSERALRTIVVGRKNWLFFGVDLRVRRDWIALRPPLKDVVTRTEDGGVWMARRLGELGVG